MTKKKSYIGATIFDGFKRHFNSALIVKNDKVAEIVEEHKVDPKIERIVLPVCWFLVLSICRLMAVAVYCLMTNLQ